MPNETLATSPIFLGKLHRPKTFATNPKLLKSLLNHFQTLKLQYKPQQNIFSPSIVIPNSKPLVLLSTMKRKTETANDTIKVATSDAIVEPTSPSLRVTKCKKKTISDRLPTDLVMEIFKRLPVKTLARLICVSKLSASIIRSRDFMKVFLTESSNRPGHLFFTFRRFRQCFLYTASLGTLNPGEASVAMSHPTFDVDANHYSSLHGLICHTTACASGLKVYNSLTRRSTTLPKLQLEASVKSHFLGYDGIDGVYKVLCMSGPNPVFQVMTLGYGSPWKTIDVGQYSHFPLVNHICIDGVLYYEACSDMDLEKAEFVMSFDVSSESFDLIKIPVDALSLLKRVRMVRYEGKLAIISMQISADGGLVLWVLDDAVKHIWLKKVFVLPNSWTSLVECKARDAHVLHRLVNVNDAGELVLAPIVVLIRHYVIYYDPKTNSMRKVAVQGIKVLNGVATATGHTTFTNLVVSTISSLVSLRVSCFCKNDLLQPSNYVEILD